MKEKKYYQKTYGNYLHKQVEEVEGLFKRSRGTTIPVPQILILPCQFHLTLE